MLQERGHAPRCRRDRSGSQRVHRIGSSLSRASAERFSPSNSLASAGSAASGLPVPVKHSTGRSCSLPRIQSLGCASTRLAKAWPALMRFAHSARLYTVGLTLRPRRALKGLGREDVSVCESVTQHQKINVTRRRVATFGDGAVNERGGDLRLQRFQGGSQRLGQPDGLARDAPQLRKQRGLSDWPGSASARPNDALSPIHCAPAALFRAARRRAGSHELDQFGCVEASLRVAERSPSTRCCTVEKRASAELVVREGRTGFASLPYLGRSLPDLGILQLYRHLQSGSPVWRSVTHQELLPASASLRGAG